MKSPFRFFLFLLSASVIFSCSQIDNAQVNTGSVSFSADDIIKNISRNGENVAAGSSEFRIILKLSGAFNTEEIRGISVNDIGTERTVFHFSGIPVNSRLDINIVIQSADSRNTVVYEGSAVIESIHSGDNRVRLVLNDKNRYVLWSTLPDMVPRFDVFDKVNSDITFADSMLKITEGSNSGVGDFYFDKHKNLYTIGIERDDLVIRKYPYENPRNVKTIFSQPMNPSDGGASVMPGSIAADDSFVYVSFSDVSGGNNYVKRISNVNGAAEDIPIPNITYDITAIEAGGDGTFYISEDTQRSQRGKPTVKHIDAGGKIINEVVLSEQTGMGEMVLSDLQMEGNYLYAIVLTKEPGGDFPFGGGVYTIDTSNGLLVEKSCAGYDSKKQYTVIDHEYVSPDYFYCPVKFVGRDKGKLIIADDGIYSLCKSGYEPAYRNVDRVVTMSLSSPDKPKIQSAVSLNNIPLSHNMEERQFYFNPPYVLFDNSNYTKKFILVKENEVTSDITVPENHSNSLISISSGSTVTDWYFDKNYNLYTIESNSAPDVFDKIFKYSMLPTGMGFGSPEMIYTAESAKITFNNIAVGDKYIYFVWNSSSGGNELKRIDLSTKLLDSSFTNKVSADVTAIEVDNEYVYLALSYDDTGGNPVRGIEKFINGDADALAGHLIIDLAKICSNPSFVQNIKISDLQLMGKKLYLLVNLINAPNGDDANGYSKGCVYPLDLTKWEFDEPVGLISGQKPANPPSSSGTDFFYGPYKFVALKPDELVIADDGWYGNCENANSIVNMKLENGVPKFKSRTVLTNATLGGEIAPNGCYFQ